MWLVSAMRTHIIFDIDASLNKRIFFSSWCLPSCLHLQLVCSALELSGKIFHKQCHSLLFQQASYDFHGAINVSRSMIFHNGAEWNLILIDCSVSIHKLSMPSFLQDRLELIAYFCLT